MTYPQPNVIDAITLHAIPVQLDNSRAENGRVLHRIRHIWTPDVRIYADDGTELYRFEGYLPPEEFIARLECAFGLAYLRTKRFDEAEHCYVDVLRRLSTTFAAPEALYYLGVTRYRRDPKSDELLTQWGNLRSRYPQSEYRLKQSFMELPQ